MAMVDRPAGDAPAGYTPTPWREARSTLYIAVPLASAYLSEHAMVLTDRIIVGRLGSVELAAVGLAGDLMFEAAVASMAIVAVVGVLVARCVGAGENDRIRSQVRQGLWVALIVGIPTTALCFYLPELLSYTGQDPQVLAFGKTYLSFATWSILPYLWFTVLRQFLAALERLRPVLIITVSTVFMNALLTYSLVFGEFGMPQMGVAGAGLATSIVSYVMFIALTVHVLRAQGLKDYSLLVNIHKIDWGVVKEIFKLGLPVGAITALESGLFAVIAIMVGTFGATALAANLVVTSSVVVVYISVFSIGEAAALRVSYHIGRTAPRSARQAGFVALAMGIVLMSAGVVIFLVFPRELASIFIDVNDPKNAEVVSLAVTLFAIAAAFQLSDGIQSISTRALRGLKDTFVPMWIAAISYWGFGIGSGYVLAFVFDYKSPGLWWGLVVGLTFAATALTWRFYRLSSQRCG